MFRGLLPVPVMTRQNSTASPLLSRKSFDNVTAPVSPRVTRRAFPQNNVKQSPGM